MGIQAPLSPSRQYQTPSIRCQSRREFSDNFSGIFFDDFPGRFSRWLRHPLMQISSLLVSEPHVSRFYSISASPKTAQS